jgi:hypothetical protein
VGDKAPFITRANGMAVRMRERTKAVRYDLRLPRLAPVLSIDAEFIYTTPLR